MCWLRTWPRWRLPRHASNGTPHGASKGSRPLSSLPSCSWVAQGQHSLQPRSTGRRFGESARRRSGADWAQHPDATINYTLPGGGSCELRLGEFQYSPDPNRPADVAADPRSIDAALNYLHSADVLADSDVDGVIQENRSDENWADDGTGNPVPFGYGTDSYNADVEYNLAVSEAVQEAITAHLHTLGIPSTGLGYQSQERCTGMTQ